MAEPEKTNSFSVRILQLSFSLERLY